MPELPEVETTLRGIEPHVCEQLIERVILRETRLRWPISAEVSGLQGRRIRAVSRRGKYLLMHLDRGNLIWHLGMSGSMRILPTGAAAEKHEHVEFQLSNGMALKFRDPRRFGALLYCAHDPLQHRLLRQLGPEPLSDAFDTDYLYHCCRKRSAAIKPVLMNSHIVVGVGNIYASEACSLPEFVQPVQRGASANRVLPGWSVRCAIPWRRPSGMVALACRILPRLTASRVTSVRNCKCMQTGVNARLVASPSSSLYRHSVRAITARDASHDNRA